MLLFLSFGLPCLSSILVSRPIRIVSRRSAEYTANAVEIGIERRRRVIFYLSECVGLLSVNSARTTWLNIDPNDLLTFISILAIILLNCLICRWFNSLLMQMNTCCYRPYRVHIITNWLNDWLIEWARFVTLVSSIHNSTYQLIEEKKQKWSQKPTAHQSHKTLTFCCSHFLSDD